MCCGESENQDYVPKGRRRFKCKDFSSEPIREVEEVSEFAKIAALHVYGVFLEMFDISCDEGKERLKGFLNAIYFPESDGYKITKVEPLQTNYLDPDIHLDIACKCTATKENDSQMISFDFEMQNQYRIDEIGRFIEYATLLKSTQPDYPIKLLVLLNRKGEGTTIKARLYHNGWWVKFPHLKYENGHWRVDTRNQMPQILAKSPQISQIDIRDVVSKILNNESVYFSHEGESRELSYEALEWIKLFGVVHWATEIQHERYVVPSGDSIASEGVRKAVSFLRGFDKVRYEVINKQFREDMNNISNARRDGANETLLKSLWNLFKENKGLDKSDFTVRYIINSNISFTCVYVDCILESEEDEKVISFLHALKNVGLLEDDLA